MGVYSLLCQDHIVPNDIDIIDAFGSSFPDASLAEPSQDAKMAAMRDKVARTGCEMVCKDEGSKRKRKKKKKKSSTKKGKKKTSNEGKVS